MRLLLGSGGYRTPERRARLADEMRDFFGSVRRLLFVPYALADHDGYVRAMRDAGLDAGYELIGVHTLPDPVRAVREAEGVFVGGGNTFRLLDTLQRLGLVSPLRERVRGGMGYMGVSAGTNVACPTMQTTNDMPIVRPASFEALGLVPFQINAHYFEGQVHVKHGEAFHEHFGETRDQRIAEFHEENGTPVIGLWEAGILRREGSELTLKDTPARLFRRGEEPVDVPAGTRLDEWLT